MIAVLAPAAIAALLTLVAEPVSAQTVILPNSDPTLNDGQVGNTIVSGGAIVTMQGSGTLIVPGITGTSISTLAALYASGRTTDPHANPADPASLVINTGNKTQTLIVPDPVTGGTRTIAVYDNTNMSDTQVGNTSGNYSATVNGPTSNQQYTDMRMGQVDATGGTLNVAIGDMTTPTDSADNYLNLGMAKQTSLFYADGTGTATSTITWQGTNAINMGPVVGALTSAGPGPVTSTGFYQFGAYNGTFTAFDGSSHSVTNATELQNYNSFLVTELQAGRLDPAQYDAEFGRAYTSTATPVTYTNGPPAPDEVYQPLGQRVVIQADGINGQGIVAAGARLDVLGATNTGTTITSGVLLATNGATIVNNGQISLLRLGTDTGANMIVLSGGNGTNNGVLNAGFLSGMTGEVDPAVPTKFIANSTGVYVSGAGSTFANAIGGVINMTAGASAGILLASSGTATNAGVINVGIVTPVPNDILSLARADGVRVVAGTQFTNLAGGEIYLGRQPQYAAGAATVDIANGTAPLSGIAVLINGSANNQGTITIGTQVQGSYGIYTVAGTGAVVNSGTINVNGTAGAAPLENYGIYVVSSTNVSNTGIVNVNGVNGIGLRLFSAGASGSATATSSGTINVAGALGATGLRNYGVWSEGTLSIATISGDVNLTGIGGIGVHARNGGRVSLTGSGNVNFIGGSNQIGYFIYGSGSSINNAGTGAQDVSTPDSTLFRIEYGAVFNGGTGGTVFTASGARSTAFMITGAPSTFNSGNIMLNLTGQDAVGVVIEGGAVGTITSAATLNLAGANAIGGVVDGQKHDLSGTATGLPDAATTLTNNALVTSATAGVTGFIAQNSGHLVNNANVSLTGAGSVGIIVRANGVVDNTSTAVVTATNGTGVRIEGAGAQLANTGIIQASDGMAALHLASGAGVVTGGGQLIYGGTAHGILISSGAQQLDVTGSVINALNPTAGSGAGIENAGEISNVKLTNTTINVGNGLGIRTATSFDPASIVTINVSGSGTGLGFQTAVGANASGDLTLGGGYVINGTGAGSTGISARTTGIVNTAANVTMSNAASGAALVVGTAASSTNSGTLSSVSTVAPVVDLTNGTGTSFSNSGTVNAVDVAHQAVLGSTGNDTVNMSGGAVRGVIAMGGGTNNVNWTAGSLNGSIEMGTGSNNRLNIQGVDLSTTYHLDGSVGAGDVLTFAGITHRGGSFAADNLADGVNLMDRWETINFTNGTAFTLTDNLHLAGSTVNIDATSTLYGGNNVLSAITDPGGGLVTLNNAGLIDLTNGSSGPSDRLTIVGNYVGQGGRVALDTYLDSDGSASDRLVISGGTATGSTFLAITNAGGPGNLTVNDGIMVVETSNGATTAAGSFNLASRVAAGGYEYLLYQGGNAATGGDANDQNWYLRVPTAPPPLPPEPDCETTGSCGHRQPPVTPIVSVPRPEVATNTVIVPLAITYGYAMLDTLHERVGETWISPQAPVYEQRVVWCKDPAQNFKCVVRTPVLAGKIGKNEERWAKAGWARLIGNRGLHQPDNYGTRGPNYDYTFGGIQAGLDLYAREQADGTLDKAGIYIGYGQISSDVRGMPGAYYGGKAGSVDMDAYTLGGYWTHFSPSGWYTDAVVQGTWYTNTSARSVLNETLKPDGFGILGSLEAGYAFKLGNDWTLEPQAQIVYQNVTFNNASDSFGRFSFQDGDSLRGRLGVRVTKTWNMADEARPRLLTTWLRANVWHEFLGKTKTTVTGFSGENPLTTPSYLGGTWGEIGIGVSGQVSENVSLFGTGAYQRSLDNKGRQGWDGRLGVTVKW